MDWHAEALAKASKELKLSQEAYVKAHSSADSAARQADKLTQKLANMPKVPYPTLLGNSGPIDPRAYSSCLLLNTSLPKFRICHVWQCSCRACAASFDVG